MLFRMTAKTPKTATSAIATPDATFGPETVAPSSDQNGIRGERSTGRKRNTHDAVWVSQTEAARFLGVNTKTLREWGEKGARDAGCFNDRGHINLGAMWEWSERRAYDRGATQERAHAASTGTLTIAEMDAEIKWHQLMKVKREEGVAQSEWVLLEVVEANLGRMLGRVRSMLRVLPEVVDPDLELAMLEGGATAAKRKAILGDAIEEVCRIVTMDRIINGDPEDREDDDLEERLAIANAELEAER